MAGEIMLKTGSSKKFLDYFKVFNNNENRGSIIIPSILDEAWSKEV